VSLPERPRTPWLRHRTAATAATLALIGGTIAAGPTAAQASIPAQGGRAQASIPAQSGRAQASIPARGGSPHPGVVQVMTASGHYVALARPRFTPTPVHPEKITHPRLDFMGSTIPHFLRASGGKPSPALKPSTAVKPSTAPRSSTAPKPATVPKPAAVPQLPGIDISAYQGNINWAGVAPYIDFSYTKATEGTYYTNPYFYNQYVGPYDYGVIRGSYHFAIPNNSSGKTQADYFIAHGGGWSADGKTLPGALDIEYNPYGQECYNLTQSQMVSWVWNFVNEYAYREHAYPVIYSTTDWWSTCTGNNGGFGKYDPLWIANYSASHGGTLPNGWGFYTFWQYADHGSLPGDQDVFNGYKTQLKTLATKG
jgi:GH25 family lysozyme M1 (1,4-beta-N-acetylmuramidase)